MGEALVASEAMLRRLALLLLVQLARRAAKAIGGAQPLFAGNVLWLLAGLISRYEFKMKNLVDENSSSVAGFRYKINNAV